MDTEVKTVSRVIVEKVVTSKKQNAEGFAPMRFKYTAPDDVNYKVGDSKDNLSKEVCFSFVWNVRV